ncbi:hypothetical protein RHGRI_025697 [Rhododendron griersonianum]|uniref:Uncharacterized protein n=1 Tax=Rhododendron griersonianum TaxID=479676 RepID=A0AAV6ITH6_9ERIC|nr:hypothetical protein RHGRI_025697 [Rhododendron griersonianum]
MASSGSSSKEVVARSELATESDSLDSQTASIHRCFGRAYRTGGMSNSDTFDPTDESWLEMPLVISPLQMVDPLEIVEIEDDSPSEASAHRRDREDTLAEEEEEAEEGGENVVEGEAVDTSKVNRFFLKLCKNKPSLEKAILFFPEKERDAPTILKYKPTYQGFIRQKGKKPANEDKPIQKAKVAKQTQRKEKLEEVLEDSFGLLPECLRSSAHRPLRGKIREARDETTDEEGEEIEMAPRNILADLEKRKKEKEEAKAKASSKTGPSAGGPSIRSTRSKGSSIQVPDSPAGKRPLSSSSQDKDVPKDTRPEKKQRTETGSGGKGETTKGKGVSGSAVPWRPLFVTPAPEKRQIMNEDSLAADPSIARVLYHGLALPKDVTMPASLKSAIDDHYFHAGRLSGATEQARAEGKKEMEKEMKEEMEKEKQKAFDKGYTQGYNKAGDELVDQVEQAEIVFKQ